MDFNDESKVLIGNQAGDPFNVPARNDQHMNVRFGLDVSKRYNVRIFVNEFSRNLTGGDFTKNTVHATHF